MKFKKASKFVALIFILTFSVFFTSCSSLGFGTTIPSLYTDVEFQNDEWLLIDNTLINKNTSKIYPLEMDESAKIEGIDWVGKQGSHTYKVDFEKNQIKLYTFVDSYDYPDGSNEPPVNAYYQCMLTYDYEGHVIDRVYLSDSLSEEQMLSLYNTMLNKFDAFSFEIDRLWELNKEDELEYASLAKHIILEHIETSYYNSRNAVVGISKEIGNEIWFSVVACPNTDFNSGFPLFEDIYCPKIKKFNQDSREIDVVFEYNKYNEVIVDFTENGIYTISKTGKLKYVDMESKNATTIYNFPQAVIGLRVTDNYIVSIYKDAKVSLANGYNYFVYEKGKDIVANDLILG